MVWRVASFCFVAFLLLCGAACDSDPVGKRVPVKGKVTVNGKALKQGSLVYWPDTGKGNKSPFEAGATIGDDGSYELFTKGKAGAPPGAYKVTVAAQTTVDSTTPDKAKNLVPSAYTTKETTPLLIDVVETPGADAYDLKIK